MSDLTVQKNQLPASILGNIVPLPVPPHTYDVGLVKGFFDIWKRKQMAEAARLTAEIAESQCRATHAYITQQTAFMTASSSAEVVFRRNNHEIKMMEITEHKAQSEALVMHYLAEQERIAAEMSKKAFDERFGGDNGE
jgi:hypothetical protein